MFWLAAAILTLDTPTFLETWAHDRYRPMSWSHRLLRAEMTTCFAGYPPRRSHYPGTELVDVNAWGSTLTCMRSKTPKSINGCSDKSSGPRLLTDSIQD